MGLPQPFQVDRLNPQPLDSSSVVESFAKLDEYLLEGIAYPGQIISVLDTDTGKAIMVMINADLTYEPVGGITEIPTRGGISIDPADLQAQLITLTGRVEGLERLGSHVGTFDTYAELPTDPSAFDYITINDYAHIRKDETNAGQYSRYYAKFIAPAIVDDGDGGDDTGDETEEVLVITWELDDTWESGAGEAIVGNEITVSATGAAGGFKAGDVIPSSMTFEQLVKQLFNPTVKPTYAVPTLSLAGSQPLAREIGESITPSLTPTFSQKDGGTATQYRLFKDGTGIFTDVAVGAHTDSQFVISAITKYKAEVDYDQGAVKNNSEGKPDPTGQISAGKVTSSDVTYTPQRKAFFGALASDTEPDSSAFIRGLTSSILNPNSGTKLAAVIPIGSKGVCFAYPTSLPAAASITSALLGNVPIEGFSYDEVAVEGANSYPAVDYRVYYIITAGTFKSQDTYTLTI